MMTAPLLTKEKSSFSGMAWKTITELENCEQTKTERNGAKLPRVRLSYLMFRVDAAPHLNFAGN